MAGIATAEIADYLAASEWDLSAIIEDQLRRLDGQLTALGTLRHRLAEVAAAGADDEVGLLSRAQQAVATAYSAHKAVAMLPYDDVAEAQRWLGDVFGLAPGPMAWPSDDTVGYASVITGQGLVHLHQSTDGFKPPAETGPCTAMIIVTVDDVDRLAERISCRGAHITHGPADMPYDVRELGAADLAGHLWCFHQPLS